MDATDTYNLPNHTTEFGVISNVQLNYRGKKSNSGGDGAFFGSLYTGSGIYDGFGASDTSITTHSRDYATNPYYGGAWTWAQIDALQIGGVVYETAALDTVYIYDVWVVVTYTPGTSLTVSDTIHVHDALGLKSIRAMADVVHVKEALGALVSSIIAEVVKLHDSLTTFFGYVVTVADTIHVHDALTTWLASVVADAVHVKDALGRWVAGVFSDTIRLSDSWVSKVYNTLADMVHLHDYWSGGAIVVRVFSDIIHVKDCVVRWRWLTAIRNLGRGRCPKPTVREQPSIDDGHEG